MKTRILGIGDVVGKPGCRIIREKLADFCRKELVDCVVANGENLNGGNGLLPGEADMLFKASGEDAIGAIIGVHYALEELVAIVEETKKYSVQPLGLLTRICDSPEQLSDDEVANAVRILGDNGAKRIPLVPFTIGDRSDEVATWTHTSIAAKDCWISDVNPKTNAVLEKHKFNLDAAAPELLDEDGWRTMDGSIGSLHPIICISKEQVDGGGAYQLLDGCHRVVGVAKVDAELKMGAFLGITQA